VATVCKFDYAAYVNINSPSIAIAMLPVATLCLALYWLIIQYKKEIQ
jgi:di/tricarboxylate transporter